MPRNSQGDARGKGKNIKPKLKSAQLQSTGITSFQIFFFLRHSDLFSLENYSMCNNHTFLVKKLQRSEKCCYSFPTMIDVSFPWLMVHYSFFPKHNLGTFSVKNIEIITPSNYVYFGVQIDVNFSSTGVARRQINPVTPLCSLYNEEV